MERYSTAPMVIPSEIVKSYAVTTTPTDGGLNCVLYLNMNNVKEIILLFPRLSTDLTCYYNPMLRGLQLRFGNKVFPERGAETNSYELLRYTLEAANLDAILQSTEAFENSIIRPPQTRKPY
jgi:hypothetical protein